MPDWYAEGEPVLRPGEEQFMRAFWHLSTQRPLGFGAFGPIPVRDAIWYFERQGMSRDLVDASVEIVRAMDAAYLAWQGRKKPKGASRRSDED